LKKFVAKVTLVTVTRLLSRAADASDQPCASWHAPYNQKSLLHANAAVQIERFFSLAGGVACHLQAGYRISLARAMVYFLAPSCPEKISGLRLSEKKKSKIDINGKTRE
jgi:hypothetical protein